MRSTYGGRRVIRRKDTGKSFEPTFSRGSGVLRISTAHSMSVDGGLSAGTTGSSSASGDRGADRGGVAALFGGGSAKSGRE